jgi:hypothetical protein
VAHEGPNQTIGRLRGQPVGRYYGPAGDPAYGRDAGDPGVPVDQHGAAAALALRAATILGRADTEILAQDLEQ